MGGNRMSDDTWHLPELVCPSCNKQALQLAANAHSNKTGVIGLYFDIYCANYDCRLNEEDWETGCNFRAVIEPYKSLDCDCGGEHHELRHQ